ncbi:MAG: isopeptide-forming domain-containing fimbrial protein [Pseudomonadota bacterium]
MKFALVIHNTGALDAHDLLITDVLPAAGYDAPTLATVNLQIFAGDGTALTLDGGSALDLFAGGIRIADLTATNGAVAAGYDPMGTDDTADDVVNATGSNIIVITYDLIAAADIEASSAQSNTAAIAEYAGLEGGNDLTAGSTVAEWEDDALTVAAPPSINKVFLGTSEPSTTGMTATIGEEVTYELIVTVPEGEVPDLRITEIVPPGMQYVAGSAVLVTSAGGSANLTADFGGTVNNLTVSGGASNGATVTFDIDGASGAGSHDFASGDNNIANNSFAIQYTLVVLNDSVNATQGDTLRNTGQILFTDPDGPDNDTGTGSSSENLPSNPVDVGVVEPNVSITKGVVPATADAGDTVTITLDVVNTGGSDAFDVIVTDFIDPAKFTNVSAVTTPAGFIFDFGTTPNTVTYTADPGIPGIVPSGGGVQFVFTAELTAAVNAGETITNTAVITQSTSLPGVDPNERNEPIDDPSADHSASDDVDVPGPSAVKNFIGTSIVDTSAGISNDNNEAVIGENLIYELVVTVPEGENGSVTITDTLDAGLAFVELVSVTSSSANLTTTIGAGDFSDAIPAAPGATPFIASVNNVTNQAQQVVFDLGSITNADNEDGSPNTAETVTLRYVATVLNVAGNQSTANEAGPSLGNSAVVSFNNGSGPVSQTAVSSPTDVLVIEPVLITNKSVEVAGGGTDGDAGDTVTYTIRVEHDATSETAAYDIVFSDDIPDEIINILPGGFNVSSNAGVTAADFTFTAGANTIVSIADIDLELGEFFEITVIGQIDPAISVGQDLVNTATSTWSNQDGAVTNTSEYVGDGSDEERDGAGGVDDYTDQGTATISVAAATIDKLDPTPSDYTIGDIINYSIVVNLSEGLIQDLVVIDDIPVGLEYIAGSAQIVTNAAASGGLLTADYSGTLTATPTITAPGGSGGDITFDFGDTTTTQDNVDTNNAFVIQLQTRVLNIVGNQSTDMRTNDADLQFTDPVTSGTQTIDDPTDPVIPIVEPDLIVDKQILSPTTNVDAGDTVRYQIQVLHSPTSTAAAYDINLTDSFSGFLENLTIVSADIDGTDVAALFTINASDDLVPLDANAVDLPLNQVLTITVEGTVVDSVNLGDVISNSVDIDWTSQNDNPGDPANPDERGGGGGVNDYTATGMSDDIVIPASLDVVKTVDNPTPTVGDVLTYTLTVNVSEGSIENLDIDDTLPAGLSYIANSAQIIGNGDISFPGVTLSDLQASGNANLAGSVLQIDIANVVNPGGSNATANNGSTLETDSFQITYQVRVDNDAANVFNGAVLTNDADASADGGLSDNDNQVDVTIAEPQLQTDKNLLTPDAAVEAGDTVSYEILVSHAGSSGADAFDLNITDDIPDILESVTISAFIGAVDVGPSGSGIIFLDGGGDIATQTNALDLLQGQSLRIVITGTVADSVVAGDTIANAVALTWTGQDDDPGDPVNNEERDGDDDYEEMDPADNIDVPVAGTFEVAKTANTGSATVGDVVTYTLRVTIFEGTTNNIQIVDTLPDGFAYQAGSAVIANANGITLNGFNANIAGQTLTIDLTSAVNPGDADNANALDTDFFDITYEVLVTNTSDISNGDTKTNDADATADGVPADVDNQVDVLVVEPQLTLQKDLLTPSSGVVAGDTVTYRITVSHTGGSSADAYDLNISDDIPAILNGISIDSALINGVTDVSGLFAIVGGDLVTPDPNALDLLMGQTLVIEISGTISVGLGPTDVISNSADLTWTGQNDAPGGGNNPNERGGDGTGENDYNDSDPADNITAANTFNLTKTASAGSVTIGELITYTLSVQLIDGTTNNIQIVDTLPDGFAYQAGSAIIFDAADMTINGFSATPAGQVLTIDITDVTNPAGGGDVFQITYQARVENTADNRNGDIQTNDADATADGVPDDVDNQVSTTIVEPQLEINKNLLSSSVAVDAGDIVQYELLINHTTASSADAFDINITDDMPAILENVSIVSALVDGATDIAGLLLVNGANDLTTPDPTLIDLALGSQIRIVIQGEIRDSASPGDSFVNGADIEWTSLDGVDPNERGSGGGENDYSDSDPAPSITVPGTLSVTKIADIAQATIGDIVTYTLQITVVEGTTQNINIVDTLPDALIYQGGSAAISNANGMTISAPVIAPAGQILTIDIASVLNPGNTDDSASLDSDTFEISYQVLVANDPANQAGDTKTNDADVTADGVPGDLNNEVDVTIAEPILEISKVASDDTPHYGDEVTYTVVVEHDQDGAGIDSLADAFDLVIADSISSPGLTFVDNSVTLVSTAGATNVTITDQVGDLEITADSLSLGGSIEFTYRVTVSNDPATNPLGTVFSNTATVDYDTQPGTDPNERDRDDDVLEQVTLVGADLAIDKDNAAFALVPGLTSTYTLTITNNGTDVATGVTITDTLPLGLTFNAASDGGAETAPGSGIIVWNALPDIPIGGSIMVSLTVDVTDPVPFGVVDYQNNAVVSHDDTEPTPADNTDDDVDLLDPTGGPDLAVTKTLDQSTYVPGEAVTYTLTVSNIGNQNASGVILTDVFPTTALDFVGVGPNNVAPSGDHTFVSFDGTTLTWDLDVVNAGEVVTLNVFASIKNPLPSLVTDFTNQATVVDDGSGNPDLNPDNNSSLVVANINAAPDIAVTKTNNLERVQPLETTTYTIMVSNQGNQNATGIEVSDIVDVSIFENITPSNQFLTSFDPATGEISWTIPTLAGGASLQLEVQAMVKINIPPGVNSASNSVTAMDDGANGPDLNPNNNTAIDEDELLVFAFDGVRDEVFGDEEPGFRAPNEDDRFKDPLPISTLYSGWTEPGTTLKFKIFNEYGNELGEQVVVADSGGNWVANFAHVYITDTPHDMQVSEQQPVYNASTLGSYNLRTYFAPSFHGQVFFLHHPTVASVFSNMAENVNHSIHESLMYPIQLGWDNTYGYEYLASSATTTQTRE